jgi:hypothetical protein
MCIPWRDQSAGIVEYAQPSMASVFGLNYYNFFLHEPGCASQERCSKLCVVLSMKKAKEFAWRFPD